MRKLLKISAIVLGVFVGLILLLAGGVFALLQSDYLRGEAQSRAGALLGRDTSFADLNIDWGWVTHVRLKDVKVANAEWGKAKNMLEADLVDFQIELMPLLKGSFVLPEIEINRPKIALEKDKKGNANWSFEESPGVATAAEMAAPEERDEAPTIGRLVITKGKMTYLDRQKDLALAGDLHIGAGEAEGADKVEFHAEGKLEGKPLTVNFAGGSIKLLQDTEQPYPLKLAIDFGKTSVDVAGKIDDPFTMEGADLEMKLKGPDLAEIFPILGVPAPPTPPYSLKGHLTRKGDVWEFRKMAGIVGNSDLNGDVKIDYGPKRPFLTAKLTSKVLDFDDLGPLVGLPPATEGKT
jgi:AsmA family protein